MTTISVNVANSVAANVTVSNGSTVNAAVGNGGAVNVSTGTISPGNATVVSGTLTINSVTTLAAGSSAFVKNDAGTAYAAKLDIGLPAGPATLVSLGNTTTLSPSSNATVTGTTDGGNLTLAFGIPRGATPSFAIGNVVTGAAGSSASVTATTANNGANVTLDLTIPRGDPGTNGTSGSNGTNGTSITLSDATPANLGTASAGSSNLAARADHTHLLPSLSTLGAAAASHAHNYVTSLNNLTGALTLAAGSNVTLTTNGSTLTLSSSAGGLGANDAVDGGDYIGEILAPSISISSQPANTTAYLTSTIQNLAVATANVIVGKDIISDGSRLLAFGGPAALSSGPHTLLSSTSGTAWSSLYTLPSNRDAECIASAGNSVVVSAHVTSSYNTTFTNGTSTTTFFQSVELFSSTDAGTTWSKTLEGEASSMGGGGRRTLSHGGGRFVAMSAGSSGPESSPVQTFYSSSDGASWTSRSVPQRQGVAYHSIAYGGGKFLAVGQAGLVGAAASSTDGISWTKTDTAFPFRANGGQSGVVYGNGRFVSLSSASAVVSTDGVNWSTSALPSGVSYDGGIAFTGGLFIALGDGVDAAVSSDGQAWTYREMPSSLGWAAVASLSGALVGVVGDRSTSVITGTVGPSGTTNATLSVSAAVTTGVASYQWQLSTDAGSTWSNISGATASTLSLTGLTTADSGKRYRVSVSATGAATVTSTAATLTVT